jgi:hypothetical protein
MLGGVLIDLMLFDSSGKVVVNRFSALPMLQDIPVIS